MEVEWFLIDEERNQYGGGHHSTRQQDVDYILEVRLSFFGEIKCHVIEHLRSEAEILESN